jgi:hypothetical protein
MNIENDNKETYSFKRLTVAVWILGAFTALNFIATTFVVLSPTIQEKRFQLMMRNKNFPAVIKDQYTGFHDWPVKKQIQAASVIAIARYETEGKKLKCVISEILKKDPDTDFYYQVGDEYERGSHYMSDDTTYGDGQIIFFTGSPASMKYSCSFTGDRVMALGGMPFDELRETIANMK